MRCISPFNNGSYHMGMIRTNRQLGEGFLALQCVRNILMRCISPFDNGSYQQMSIYSESTIRYQLHSFFTTRIYSGVLDNPPCERPDAMIFGLAILRSFSLRAELEIIFLYSEDICPFKSSFWSDI